MKKENVEQRCINTIRILSADMVEKAKSGHPGLPLGAAGMAYVLWTKFLKHNSKNPNWPNRDRFVLSAGHGSALLYALLHLFGYALPLEELKRFRQWGSKTPGHPEYGHTPGVETTTGPLGQGFATGVGMAMAERFLAEYYNRPGHTLVDYHIYGICGDGDLMEGISAEAASIAGHLKLGKLIYLYDDNQISIEGSTSLTFSESVQKRFEAYGWQVIGVEDGNNLEQLISALAQTKAEEGKPSLIQVRTHIGYGSPNKQDTPGAHGEPLGEAELRLVKERFRFPPDQDFIIPSEVRQRFCKLQERGMRLEEKWNEEFKHYAQAYPQEAADWKKALQGELPSDWEKVVPIFSAKEKLATRQASGKILNALAAQLPLLVGGSADLAPSTATHLKGYCDFSADQYGCPNFHFGVREHAMGAILNGLALSKQLRPYGATFLVFSDYMKPAIRLAAVMNIPVIFVFTHDSIGLGEDGLTHQPIEHLAALRAIPNLTVIRPADANETAQAWQWALQKAKPTALILSRQKLPVLDPKVYPIHQGMAKGAYVLKESREEPEVVLIATGSEVQLALSAQAALQAKGKNVRVVSLPSWELFAQQPRVYQEQVLPTHITKRVSIEAGVTLGWERWVGSQGECIGINTFGASAPGEKVMQEYGFTVERIEKVVQGMVGIK
ncbi:transketolase [bacterium]|nr:transketolase [bacterium]